MNVAMRRWAVGGMKCTYFLYLISLSGGRGFLAMTGRGTGKLPDATERRTGTGKLPHAMERRTGKLPKKKEGGGARSGFLSKFQILAHPFLT